MRSETIRRYYNATKGFINSIDKKIDKFKTYELNIYLQSMANIEVKNRTGFIIVKFAKDMLNFSPNQISFVKIKDNRTGYKRDRIITYSHDDIHKIKEFIMNKIDYIKFKKHKCYYPFLFMMHFGYRPYEALYMPFTKLTIKNDGAIIFRLPGDKTKTHQEYVWHLTS